MPENLADPRLAVVGIGSSAGGLEATTKLLEALPATSGLAFILVQHLEPSHKSMLADLLATHTAMPVLEATQDLLVEPDHVYVIPPGATLTVEANRLALSPPPVRRGARMPFDVLLRSMAECYGARAACIVLSGTGADGSAGALAISACGGLVLAQQPEEAGYDGMPRSAIRTGAVKLVLPVEAMPAALLQHRPAREPPNAAAAAPQARKRDPVPAILELLRTQTAHDFTLYKPGTIRRRIERRMALVGLKPNDVQTYLETLRGDRRELDLLARDLLINVTSFFRDDAVFDRLAKTTIPELVAGHAPATPLRVWIAGCSTGEEAYSLAMLLIEQVEAQGRPIKLQLFASDVDAEAVAAARNGRYATTIESCVSPERLARFFSREAAGWRVSPELRGAIVFTAHDVLADPPFSRLDLVSCRNLLIYLAPASQADVIRSFHFALRKGGILLLGSAETVGGAGGFEVVGKAERIYRRVGKAHAAIDPKPDVSADQADGAIAARRSARLASSRPAALVEAGHPARLAELEQALARLRAQLRNAVRDLALSDDDQRAINDEAQSVNEEVQSTNEELLASKEELQSMNEELTALNSQLLETLERQRTTSDDLQNVLYSTNVATVFLDLELRIRFFTPATTALFAVIPSDVGRKLADFAALAPDSALESDARAVLERQAPIEREIKTRDDVWFRRRILPYRSQGERMAGDRVEGVVITFTDVTQRIATAAALEAAKKQAEAANAAKSRFLAAASHDLRQPLQTLSLLQALLAKTVEGEASQGLVARLDDTLGAMSAMLDTLLDINEIEAGSLNPELSAFPLDGLLDRLRREFTYHAELKRLRLTVLPCGVQVLSEPRLLEQMLRNLLSNALKYTAQGRILVGCRRRGDALSIEIWDTGVGIPAAELDTIFEEYHQLDNPARERSRGLGLGLSIVKRLGALLGHPVSVRSRPGRGSGFAVEVPRCPAATTAPLAAAPRTPVRRRGLILVVEDDPDLRGLLSQLLQAEGHEVQTAADSPSALSSLAGAAPDLVLADYNLPNGPNGLGLVAGIRDTLGRAVPAIILTGDISTRTRREVAGHDCVQLNKPVKQAELMSAIDRLLVAPASPAATMPAAEERPIVPAADGPPVVFVVDDDVEVRGAIIATLEDDGRMAIGHASGEAFLQAYRPGSGACLLVDAYLPGISGIELLERLRLAGHALPAIMITGHSDVAMAVRAMKAGAVDFIEKPVSRGELLASLGRALEQSRDATKLADWQRAAAGHLAGLTPRQREVMSLVLAGHPSKNIAADLGISQRTVENHRASIMHKTGTTSLPALARLALAAAS